MRRKGGTILCPIIVIAGLPYNYAMFSLFIKNPVEVSILFSKSVFSGCPIFMTIRLNSAAELKI